MPWGMVSGICAIIFTILQVVSAVIALKIRNEITEIKLHIAETRAKDREDLREWADDRFLRKENGTFRSWAKPKPH